MARIRPAGAGHKRPQLDVPIERLHLDPENPRLPEEIQGKHEEDLLQHLFDHFDLEEIADPMGRNGYFDEEPLVVVPQKIPAHLLPKEGKKESAEYFDFIKRDSTHLRS
jgi:hypothetical protein